MTGRDDPLRGLRVLVVEDEPVVAMFLEDALLRLGCAVAGVAARLDEAVRMAGTAAFDAAVMDVNLRGGAKSLPVAEALAARGVPFVVATGYEAAGLPEALRARPLLLKPYGEADLGAALRRALREAAAAGRG